MRRHHEMGGDPVASSCGLILEGAMRWRECACRWRRCQPTRLAGQSEVQCREWVQVSVGMLPLSATTCTHDSAWRMAPSSGPRLSKRCRWLVFSGVVQLQSHWYRSLEMLCVDELSSCNGDDDMHISTSMCYGKIHWRTCPLSQLRSFVRQNRQAWETTSLNTHVPISIQ
jgi:hypothetical protein